MGSSSETLSSDDPFPKGVKQQEEEQSRKYIKCNLRNVLNYGSAQGFDTETPK